MQDETMKQEAGGRGDRIEALKVKVDALAKLTQELDEARSSAKRTRVGIVIGILLVFVIFGLVFYQMYKSFDQADFVEKVQTKLMTPDSQTMALFEKSVREVLPVYMAEAQKQFGAVWPEIQKQLEAESKTYLDNISAKVDEHIKTKIDEMAEKQKDKLLAEFPALKDEKTQEIVMENLEKALQGATLDVMQDRVGKAEAKLWAVYDEMLKYLPEESRDSFQARMAKAWDQMLLIKGVPVE